jgi:lauroyl/myristoyl acyltransferase
MHCPWIRIEEDTQPCPAAKENIRGELLTSLAVSRIRANANRSRVVNQDNSIQAREKQARLEEGGDVSQTQGLFAYFPQSNDFGSDEARIKGLSADELVKYPGNFYPYFYLNLLSILAGRLSIEQIRHIAIESTRGMLLSASEHLKSISETLELARLKAGGRVDDFDRELIKLSGWDLDLIRSLLRRGRGLIFCSHHLGPYRFLEQDLAFMGFKLSLMVDEVSFDKAHSLLEYAKEQIQSEGAGASPHKECSAALGNIHLLNYFNTQNKDSFISLLKALRRGESIFVYADGNTGWDGVWGGSAKSVIDFLGFPIAIKNGIARLAAACGAPILPLVTLRGKADFGKVIFGNPIIPPSGMTSEERDEFTLKTMKSIYKLLEEHALESIEQWSSSCFLHRWRIPARQGPAGSTSSPELEEIEKQLGIGKSLKINEQKIAPLIVKDETVLIDVQTLKIYKIPQEFENLFFRLSQQGGLKGSDISALNGDPQVRQKVLSLLAYLRKLQVIIPI